MQFLFTSVTGDRLCFWNCDGVECDSRDPLLQGTTVTGAHLIGKSQGCSATYSAFSKWLKSTLDTLTLFRDQVPIKSRKTLWQLAPAGFEFGICSCERMCQYLNTLLPHAWPVRGTTERLFCLQYILLGENESLCKVDWHWIRIWAFSYKTEALLFLDRTKG